MIIHTHFIKPLYFFLKFRQPKAPSISGERFDYLKELVARFRSKRKPAHLILFIFGLFIKGFLGFAPKTNYSDFDSSRINLLMPVIDPDPSPLVQQMSAELLHLGVRPGGVLLVHASLRALGLGKDIPNRPEVVFSALLEALGPDGTLLMPALSYAFVGGEQMVFDVLRTPSCVGAIPEAFRVRAGTLRSIHPTHSVCGVGRRAEELLSGHENDQTPCGPNAAFAQLPQAGGQVLFLGCGLRPNTSLHAIEEQVEPVYLYSRVKEYQIIHADGRRTQMRVRSHGFRYWEQRYERLEGLLGKGLRKGKVLQAGCHLVDATVMWDAALARLRRDPLYFVETKQ
jgi:aminoglycoside 3-N-acetyltransferase